MASTWFRIILLILIRISSVADGVPSFGMSNNAVRVIWGCGVLPAPVVRQDGYCRSCYNSKAGCHSAPFKPNWLFGLPICKGLFHIVFVDVTRELHKTFLFFTVQSPFPKGNCVVLSEGDSVLRIHCFLSFQTGRQYWKYCQNTSIGQSKDPSLIRWKPIQKRVDRFYKFHTVDFLLYAVCIRY